MINWYYIENGIIARSNYPGDIGLNIPQNTPGYWKTLENIEVGEILLEAFSDQFHQLTEEDIQAFKESEEQNKIIIRNPNKKNPVLYGNWIPDSQSGGNIHFHARFMLTLDFRSIENFKRNFLIISNSMIIAVFLILILLNFNTAKRFSNSINALLRRMQNFQLDPYGSEDLTNISSTIKEMEEIEEMYQKMTKSVGSHFYEQVEQANKLHKKIKKKEKQEKKLKTEVSLDHLTGIYN